MGVLEFQLFRDMENCPIGGSSSPIGGSPSPNGVSPIRGSPIGVSPNVGGPYICHSHHSKNKQIVVT